MCCYSASCVKAGAFQKPSLLQPCVLKRTSHRKHLKRERVQVRVRVRACFLTIFLPSSSSLNILCACVSCSHTVFSLTMCLQHDLTFNHRIILVILHHLQILLRFCCSNAFEVFALEDWTACMTYFLFLNQVFK